ncbi:lipase family protein [Pseudomonas sp. zfem002]|uniref:lipase family protein n=1 Tax=Pseudomonas sp. zfem002 TaxID=3078197 RepID=UPI0029293E25|nr:lipase family protein [Pseudomonas sp. zfem002]MDU9393619.1 lipase family protein [Pseudomonas sp. zfem002]
MNEYRHRTDTLNSCKVVTVGKQKRHWLEFQLLDEQGEPLANMPYRALNEATRTGCVPEFAGQSDEQGVIRLEGLHPLPVTLLMQADPFARELQGRRLRAERAEPPRPTIGEDLPLYGPQRSGFSPLEQQAHEAGHEYHYLRIGQLCDRLPSLTPPLPDEKNPPEYHFPDKSFGGFTVEYEQLNRRHVLEVCPFRAWSLVLHHQAEYSLANAYNLGLMSILAYSSGTVEEFGSPEELFMRQGLDLSRSPKVVDGGQMWPCLVVDVPFDERYTVAKFLNTKEADQPEGDTQLFYAVNAAQVLVAWRGTATLQHLITDLTFRPVESKSQSGCDEAVPCKNLTSDGKVHLGFRDAFDVAKGIFLDHLEVIIADESLEKDFFICGHSLGGALGIIHAADLKVNNPVLYTYGMPRTFSLKAVQSLEGLTHFRHVNDMDPIPSVPAEVELDNYLYEIYGLLGVTLGFAWSIGQLATGSFVKFGDPYAHHGETAAFYKVTQHIQERGSIYPAYRNKDGLGAPYYTAVSRQLQHKTKLYLVPALSIEKDKCAEENQKSFVDSLSEESRARFFPRNENLKKGRIVKILDHRMSSDYQPYIHNQLLEAINPERMHQRKKHRDVFEQQMADNHARINVAERDRNRAFIELQNMIGRSLRITSRLEGGPEALERFDRVADTKSFHEAINV